MSEANVTVDLDVIRRWVERRGGGPSIAEIRFDEDAGTPRIVFPCQGGDSQLEEFDWDAFFAKFEEQSLAFLYQERRKACQFVRISRFIARG